MDEETSSMARLEAARVVIEKEIAAKAEIDARISALGTEHGQIVSETAEWLYLKNACSKDGLRALEIDSVAPIISGYANDLLTQTFGPQYTVKLRTQDEETGKEVLDILTIREDGSEVNIENLSGGERVWSLKALSLAMTLISKERSGRDFKTMFCDESDGALDTGNAINFVQMYRSLMKIADIDTCFFISHKEETIGLADHVMKFATGGISID
jgi:exonuclease SbcC